jgi:hypothetical protein
VGPRAGLDAGPASLISYPGISFLLKENCKAVKRSPWVATTPFNYCLRLRKNIERIVLLDFITYTGKHNTEKHGHK